MLCSISPSLNTVNPKLRTNYGVELCRNRKLSKKREEGEKQHPRLNLLPRNNQGINPLCSPAPKTETSKSKFSLGVRRCHTDLWHVVCAGPSTWHIVHERFSTNQTSFLKIYCPNQFNLSSLGEILILSPLGHPTFYGCFFHLILSPLQRNKQDKALLV